LSAPAALPGLFEYDLCLWAAVTRRAAFTAHGYRYRLPKKDV
jgi:hypothetical protein